MRAAKAIVFLTAFSLMAYSANAAYTDYIGAGHNSGITATAYHADETATGQKTIDGSGGSEPNCFDFAAYYTKIDSGEPFEADSRTDKYADIIVRLGENQQLVFWRGSSYFP